MGSGFQFSKVVTTAELYCAKCREVVDIRVDISKDRCVEWTECPRCHGNSTTWKNSNKPGDTVGSIYVVDEENYHQDYQRMAPQFRGNRVGGSCRECGNCDKCTVHSTDGWASCWWPKGSIIVMEEREEG